MFFVIKKNEYSDFAKSKNAKSIYSSTHRYVGTKKNIVSFFKENRVNNCFPKKHSSFKNITLLFLGYV